MKTQKSSFKVSILALAIASVVPSMYAYADEEEAAALKYPTSSVQVEEIYVSQGSQKFGEYNGLNKQGGYLNGNINIRGGGGYKQNENGNTDRWSIQGTDLGLSDRSASVGYSDQGNASVSIGYDELTHNLASGYMTPYQGGMGGNSFTLPAGFGTVNTSSSTGNKNGARNLTANQQGAIQPMDVSSTRQNTSLNAVKVIDSALSFSFDFNHLNQSGAKLQSMASSSMAPGGKVQAEASSILPSPTNYQTDTVNAGAHWRGENSHLTASYFGSFFRDGTNGVNWQTWASSGTGATATNTTQTMSTMPSNQLQQLNLGGGYSFSKATNLAGNFSFARNTQNSTSAYDTFQTQPGYAGLPVGFVTPAFNGLVNTAHADLKLTDKSIKDLNLAASFKYDSRDNLSQSNVQRDYGLGAQLGIYPNVPLSYRKAQVELAGDYRISQAQKVQLVYQNQNLSRYCNQYAVGPAATYSAGPGYYPAGADCVTANFTRTNSLNATYRLKASEDVDVKLAVGSSIRQATSNPQALSTFMTYGTSQYGLNGGDRVGYMPFFEASQNQQTAKANVNWQANQDLSFGLGAKWAYSVYPASVYGVQNGTVASLNFDSTYNYAENAFASAYIVQQFGKRNMTNWSSAYNWNNSQQEKDTTLGLGFKHAGLLADKLTLNGDVTYSFAQTLYNTMPNTGNTAAGTVAGGGGYCGTSGACGSPGPITNNMASLKLGGEYKIDKSSKIGLRYIYQHLRSNDYYYNVYSYGYTANGQMPTQQNSGSYNVNVIAASYTYSFD